jgi:hypothetical protein
MPPLIAAISKPPLILTEHDAGEVADLYARCTDYFMLQDGDRRRWRMRWSCFVRFPKKRTQPIRS